MTLQVATFDTSSTRVKWHRRSMDNTITTADANVA
jgi:hypothetical protein